MRFIEPVALKGHHVIIEPLAREHEDDIRAAASDGELGGLWYPGVPSPDNTASWLDTALALRENAGWMPFIVRDGAGVAIGSTRFCNVDATNRRVEIGY